MLKDDRIIYNDLRKKLGKKFRHVDIFALAMSYGIVNNVRIPLTRKDALFKTISAGDNFYPLMVLLYIREKDEVPNNDEDLSEIIVIAQEYANGGLKLLEKDVYDQIGEFSHNNAFDILKFDYENASNFFNQLEVD